VRRNETDCSAFDEAPDDGGSTDPSVMRIGSTQNLVQKEKQGQVTVGQLNKPSQSRDFGVKARTARLEGVQDMN
jgi:hypothetical protein